MDIKEEFPFSKVISQPERESFPQDVTLKFNNDATQTKVKQCHDYEMETKTEMKEEYVDSEFCPQNERKLFSEVPVMAFPACSKNSELDTKIEIKKEMCWLERTSTEAPCADDVTKDYVDESFPSTESMRLCNEETSRDKLCLFPDENSSTDTRFNIIQDSSECETARKYTSTKIGVPEISSVQKSVYSEDDSAKSNYESVLLRNTLGRNYKCDICDNTFTSQSYLTSHILTHEGIMPHKCDTCGNCFTQLTHLKRHKLTHKGIKPHKCDICAKYFTQLSTLKTHKLIHEGKKPHKCDTCGMCFTQLKTLKAHKLIHEGVKPHKCDTCGKCFTQLSTLISHKLIHEGIKPHKCGTCGKCFTSLKTLKTHKLTHESIKPHKCDTCGNCFISLTHLKRHKLTHEGIKPHKCDTCGNCFTQMTHLKRHKLTHEGLKQHKCGTCGKCFTSLNSLKTHKLTHEGIKPHKYDTSGNFFKH